MSWKVGHPVKRDGTNQQQRLLDSLRPERNPVDDRREEDLLYFIYRLADQFVYYNENNIAEEGGWKTFFRELQDDKAEVTLESIRQYLTRAEQSADTPIFLTILMAFLKMFGHLQQDINTITQKHLDFYYEQVLGFRRLPPVPDEAHVLIELAPHINQYLLPVGTALKAGKDALGKPLIYSTNREIVVNKAKLKAIKTTLLTDEGQVFSAEVANSADGKGAPLEGTPGKWPLFGDPNFMQPDGAGLAIASPILLLGEGQRFIYLDFTFEEIPETLHEEDFRRFKIYGSGSEAWVELTYLPHQELRSDGTQSLFASSIIIDRSAGVVKFRLGLQAEDPAIVPYRWEKLSGNLDTHLPVLRMVLGTDISAYHEMKALTLKSIKISVEVNASDTQPGVQNLILQNEQGAISNGESIQPFGPAAGKNARFYIGSREVFSKPLDSLKIQLRWSDLPDDATGFAGYYEKYTDPPFKGKRNSSYTTFFQLRVNGQWSDNFDSKSQLFNPSTGGVLEADKTISSNNGQLNILSFAPDLPEFEEFTNALPQGFIRMVLEQDFGHRIYPRFISAGANPPYTPTLQSVSLGYRSSQTIHPGEQNPNARLFHIAPFNSEEMWSEQGDNFLPKLPQATLLLGFSNVVPPQNLHLLFQLAEGSAESSEIIRAEDIQWHYMTQKGWRATALSDSEIFIDTTLGLQKSGIMAFQIGRDASTLADGLQWLCAKIEKKPTGVARAISIHTQAVTAVFQDNGNDPKHLRKHLPAGAITSLVERVSAIRKVEQPYASFGGSPSEQNDRFYARISERLRHKQRAVTLWDIERLTLQQFPELYEAKVAPHTGLDEYGFYSEFQPGQITLVLIPQLRNQNAVNPLQPRVSSALLEAVRRYLQPLCTPFVGNVNNALLVINPVYEPILLSFSVGFHPEYDSGYYAGVLQQALRRWLSPWAFAESEDIRFGGKVYKSQLLAFVEEQEYVDYVADFKMFHDKAGPGVGEMSVDVDLFVRNKSAESDVDVAEASTAISILVSADEHRIRVLKAGDFPCVEPESTCEGGIGCWYVGIDFQISEH